MAECVGGTAQGRNRKRTRVSTPWPGVVSREGEAPVSEGSKWQVPSQPASSSSDDESGSEYDPNEPEYESEESVIEWESCDDE